MAKARFVYPVDPPPVGVDINLTVKEALTLRNYLLGCTNRTDPDGTIRTLVATLSDESIFGPAGA